MLARREARGEDVPTVPIGSDAVEGDGTPSDTEHV